MNGEELREILNTSLNLILSKDTGTYFKKLVGLSVCHESWSDDDSNDVFLFFFFSKKINQCVQSEGGGES